LSGCGASVTALQKRAEILHHIREFFRARDVLEVETPLLCAAGSVDEHLEPIPVAVNGPVSGTRYLVTSPEHSMKRLLAAGSGPIYQITRAFRDGERGRLHNPEFTILEWYRPGFDHHALMDEVEALVAGVLERFGTLTATQRPFERVTYRDAFRRAVGIDPHDAAHDPAELNELMATRVEPTLGLERPVFVTDYPVFQASSARIREGDPPVAERFELYVRGLELANGYHELLEAGEQERRYREANEKRVAAGQTRLPIDDRLLAALREGLPEGAGVALGVDRLVMAALGAKRIDDVIGFTIEQA
jgi:lysyl-tRNA synthetase class 2